MPIKKLMHLLANLFPNTDSGDNPVAVKLFHRMTVVKDFFAPKKFSKNKEFFRNLNLLKFRKPNV